MPDILQRLRDAYEENPASALKLLPELFQKIDEGRVGKPPCKCKHAKGRKEILLNAISTYGQMMQEDVCIEEMSELTKAIIKCRRIGSGRIKENNENVREEIADVQIMLDQMRIIYGDTTDWENLKIKRLKSRLSTVRRKYNENN